MVLISLTVVRSAASGRTLLQTGRRRRCPRNEGVEMSVCLPVRPSINACDSHVLPACPAAEDEGLSLKPPSPPAVRQKNRSQTPSGHFEKAIYHNRPAR